VRSSQKYESERVGSPERPKRHGAATTQRRAAGTRPDVWIAAGRAYFRVLTCYFSLLLSLQWATRLQVENTFVLLFSHLLVWQFTAFQVPDNLTHPFRLCVPPARDTVFGRTFRFRQIRISRSAQTFVRLCSLKTKTYAKFVSISIVLSHKEYTYPYFIQIS